MATTTVVEGPSSLLGVTVRRSLYMGRVYLATGTGISLFYAVILSAVPGSAFGGEFPLLLPVFAAIGAMGSLLVFTNDRIKGVFEYLIAYGLSPARVFVNVLLSSLVLVTIVIGSTLAVGLAAYIATGHVITVTLAAALALYSVPMSYASVAFAGTVGMFWTSLSTPRSGMNNPLGLVPIIGIAPAILTLIVVTAAGTSFFFIIGGSAVVVVTLLVVFLVGMISRLMPRERLLSPA